MKFDRLTLRNFRNIKDQNLEFYPGLNVFRGQNGQGKTNVIEAFYLLTHGKSFRTNRMDDLINKDFKSGFFLEANILKAECPYQIQVKVLENKKQFNVNNKKWSSPQVKQHFPTLLFSPESLLIIKDSAQKRRDLIDHLCLMLFPQFSKVYLDYRKSLQQKNSLLKKYKEQATLSVSLKRVFESLSELLLQKGSELTYYRLLAIEEIEPFLLNEFLKIMDEHYGNISIRYFLSGQTGKGLAQQDILNAMYKRWEELKSREWATGQCLVGPHKHDIQFDFNGQEARFFCSQGQQRAIILAFKMAQTRLHYRAHKEFPILLLDDVLSELDREKQVRFVDYLLSTEAQIFLTTTDATSISTVVDRAVFDVSHGVFSKANKSGLHTGGLSV